MKAILLSGLLVASFTAGAAQAQVERGGAGVRAIPPVSSDADPTVGSPANTGSIAATGRTKPPGAPVGEGLGTRPDLEKRSEELDRRIRTGICRGC